MRSLDLSRVLFLYVVLEALRFGYTLGWDVYLLLSAQT